MNQTSTPTRTETDSMGPMQVPADALYGASTARAVENFPVSRYRMPRAFIAALGLIKKHAASVNEELGRIPANIAQAIREAADEVIEGKLDSHFVVDIFQTGSGTSTNMNANEVIANRATQILGGQPGEKLVHPNDHVNRGQSSNDVIPTALHIAVVRLSHEKLVPALRRLHNALQAKAEEFHPILKIGRTHLMDATPIRLGQEFSGYARQVQLGLVRIQSAANYDGLCELALGGTAVGTGLNCHPEFPARVIAKINAETGLSFREAVNHFEAQAAKDAVTQFSGTLKTLACSLIKIANDIRWMGSGPRCGLGELQLAATQPGSSIMPGKVNPVMSEMLIQVCCQVIGHDAAITHANAWLSTLELNVGIPLMAHALIESIELLSSSVDIFTKRCVEPLEANAERCNSLIEQSLAMCTALAPVIGYDAAAAIAKKAHAEKTTVREVALKTSGLTKEQLEKLLDPATQTAPSVEESLPAGG
jgi:fumarate hydratase class II